MLPSTGIAFERTHRKLQRICSSPMLLPPSYLLPAEALLVEERPFACGGFSDVYKGMFDGSQVCIKKLRIASSSDSGPAMKGDTRRYHCRYTSVLMILTDALQGSVVVETTETSQYRPICGCNHRTLPNRVEMDAWRRFDDLHQFEHRCESDHSCKPAVVSIRWAVSVFRQLVDVANGLDYLHSYGVIHGDLKGVSSHSYTTRSPLMSVCSQISSWTSLVTHASPTSALLKIP